MTDDLKQIIERVADKTQMADRKAEEFIQLMVFVLDNEEYVVPITDLKEIIKIPDITPIPNAPEFIKGLLNLRGKIVVVVDLERRFHLVRENKTPSQHIIIVEAGENTFGIIVDEVAEVLRIPITSIQPTPSLVSSKIHSEYLKGVVVLDRKEPTKELTEDQCRELLLAHNTTNQFEKSNTRLLILLDLLKMLQEKELLDVGDRVIEVASEKD
ncbi:MAG: chemotaxis protein CheW [Patescibacteria group bacterium]